MSKSNADPFKAAVSGGLARRGRAGESRRAGAEIAPEGTVMLSGRVPTSLGHTFKVLSAELGRSQQEVLAEALTDLFAKYNREVTEPPAPR